MVIPNPILDVRRATPRWRHTGQAEYVVLHDWDTKRDSAGSGLRILATTQHVYAGTSVVNWSYSVCVSGYSSITSNTDAVGLLSR